MKLVENCEVFKPSFNLQSVRLDSSAGVEESRKAYVFKLNSALYFLLQMGSKNRPRIFYSENFTEYLRILRRHVNSRIFFL